MSKLKGLLIRHEGISLKPYFDTAGKTTIGVGRNLDGMGITADEAMILLENDIKRVRHEAANSFPWFLDLDIVRQDVVTSMLFNLGMKRFLGFRAMIAALQKKDYARAANEMLNSVWAAQVKGRAVELAQMMKVGSYQN